jgi:hypothetical protein
MCWSQFLNRFVIVCDHDGTRPDFPNHTTEIIFEGEKNARKIQLIIIHHDKLDHIPKPDFLSIMTTVANDPEAQLRTTSGKVHHLIACEIDRRDIIVRLHIIAATIRICLMMIDSPERATGMS